MTELPAHSPLGASGSHRWMTCPGSVTQSIGVSDSESEHAALGTAAHTLGETALRTGFDAWQYIGKVIDKGSIYSVDSFDNKENAEAIRARGVLIDKDMADAVQQYLSAVRTWHPDRNQGNFWIERRFHCPTIHELFFGTSDATYLDLPARTLDIWDYKHGAGIVVEVEWNPQILYYAAGMLEDLKLWDDVDTIRLHIAQPRGFHWKGPIRHWTIKTSELVAWLEDVLVPAMDRALISGDLKSGEDCRFCPARSRACPQLMKDMDELEAVVNTIQSAKTGAAELSNEQVARFLDLLDIAKIVGKAASETAQTRLSEGKQVPGYKLGAKRANRVFKKGAEDEAKKQFGKLAYTEPELKSPAQIEALPEGEAFCTRWAFKPDTGLTVIKGDDARPAVNRSTKSLFQPKTKGNRK